MSGQDISRAEFLPTVSRSLGGLLREIRTITRSPAQTPPNIAPRRAESPPPALGFAEICARFEHACSTSDAHARLGTLEALVDVHVTGTGAHAHLILRGELDGVAPHQASDITLTIAPERLQEFWLGRTHEAVLILAGDLTVEGSLRMIVRFLHILLDLSVTYAAAVEQPGAGHRFGVLQEVRPPLEVPDLRLAPTTLTGDLEHQTALAALIVLSLPRECRAFETRAILDARRAGHLSSEVVAAFAERLHKLATLAGQPPLLLDRALQDASYLRTLADLASAAVSYTAAAQRLRASHDRAVGDGREAGADQSSGAKPRIRTPRAIGLEAEAETVASTPASTGSPRPPGRRR